MTERATRMVIAVAFLFLAALALVGAGWTVVNPLWRPFPPDVMAVAGIGLASLAGAWLALARQSRNWLRTVASIGALLGLLIGILGVWGTTQILHDFCWRPVATASLASSIPPLSCGEVAPSILVGAYLVAVGVVAGGSIAALFIGDRSEEVR